jgi:hypothetical protein
MRVNGDGERPFRFILPDDVLVEIFDDRPRRDFFRQQGILRG